jgi:uncharacterized membrane protein YdjX (TVP38/TMEM64 family)
MSDPAAPPPARKPGLGAQISDFVTNMDARAWRAVGVTLGLFVVVAVMLVLGRLFFGDEIEAFVDTWLGGAERAHWGLPATIAIFVIAAFVGAPQIVLIGACVVAFGPEKGFWYAWGATIISGAVTYWTGKLAGAETVRKYSGATGGRFTRFMGKNGFLASLIVRFLPTAPFVIVNMAMAVSGVGFWAFLGGLALGTLPKTALVAFAGDGIMDALEGNFGAAALAGGAAILVWFFGVVLVRRILRGREDGSDDSPAQK